VFVKRLVSLHDGSTIFSRCRGVAKEKLIGGVGKWKVCDPLGVGAKLVRKSRFVTGSSIAKSVVAL